MLATETDVPAVRIHFVCEHGTHRNVIPLMAVNSPAELMEKDEVQRVNRLS